MFMYIVIWFAFTRRSLNQLFCETKAHHWCIVCSFVPKQIQQIPTNVSVKLFWFPSQKIPIQKHIQPFQPPRTNCQLPTCFKVHAAWYRVVNLKEIWSFSCWAPPTDLVRINYFLPAFTLEDFAGLDQQRQHIQIYPNQVAFIWITMSPLDAISSRKNLGGFARFFGHNIMTWWYGFWKNQHRYHPPMPPSPSCISHHSHQSIPCQCACRCRKPSPTWDD